MIELNPPDIMGLVAEEELNPFSEFPVTHKQGLGEVCIDDPCRPSKMPGIRIPHETARTCLEQLQTLVHLDPLRGVLRSVDEQFVT